MKTFLNSLFRYLIDSGILEIPQSQNGESQNEEISELEENPDHFEPEAPKTIAQFLYREGRLSKKSIGTVKAN